jgi:RecA-family ATPase
MRQWTDRDYNEAPPGVRKLRPLNPADWEGQPVPEREWIVQDFIPASTVTLLSGEGAAGKSTLALQLGAARALGEPWLSTLPRPGKTLYLSAEDDGEELHRRLDAVRSYFGAAFSALSGLRLVDLVGEDAVLGAAR